MRAKDRHKMVSYFFAVPKRHLGHLLFLAFVLNNANPNAPNRKS